MAEADPQMAVTTRHGGHEGSSSAAHKGPFGRMIAAFGNKVFR